MDKGKMHQLHGQGETHMAAPKPWRDVPNLVGDYDLDATIAHRNNPSLPDKLAMYVTRGRAYGPLTGYNGYRGYHGDN